jgi:hypothetical protein
VLRWVLYFVQSKDWYRDMLPNKALQATAAVLGCSEAVWRHSAVVAGASVLLHPPSRSDRDYGGRAAAMPEPGRYAFVRTAKP